MNSYHLSVTCLREVTGYKLTAVLLGCQSFQSLLKPGTRISYTSLVLNHLGKGSKQPLISFSFLGKNVSFFSTALSSVTFSFALQSSGQEPQKDFKSNEVTKKSIEEYREFTFRCCSLFSSLPGKLYGRPILCALQNFKRGDKMCSQTFLYIPSTSRRSIANIRSD